MAISQLLWSIGDGQILEQSDLQSEQELEDILSSNIELLNPDWLVIGRQVKTKNGKFLDLLCLERDGDLVVIELKKNLTPRDVTAQVIEYASYMAECAPSDLALIYEDYAVKFLNRTETLNDAYKNRFSSLLDEEQISGKIKMVVVATSVDSGTEHIVRYLRNTYHVDINVLFFQIFKHGTDRLLSRVWFEEDLETEEVSQPSLDWNGEYYTNFGINEHRTWEDAVKYGFISAGGGRFYTRTLSMLHVGDRIWVNVPHVGYVGVGIVTGSADSIDKTKIDNVPILSLPLTGKYSRDETDSEKMEYVVPVKWEKTVPVSDAVKEIGFFGNQNTVCRPKASTWNYTVERLKKKWNIQ